MSPGRKKYSVRNSAIVGLGSLLAYLLLVFFGIYMTWDQAFRNGQPGGGGQTLADRQAASLWYRNTFLMWMGAFALLCVLLYLAYWSLGRPGHSEKDTLLKEAQTTRWACVSLALTFLSAYARNAFVNRAVWVFDVLMGVFAIGFAIGLPVLATEIIRNITRRIRGKKPAPNGSGAEGNNHDSQPQRRSHSRATSQRIIHISDVVGILGVLLQAVFGIMNLLAWLSGVLGLFVLPEPFPIQTKYDNMLWAVPLIGLLLFYMNLKFNAHPETGIPYSRSAKQTKTLFTMGKVKEPAPPASVAP